MTNATKFQAAIANATLCNETHALDCILLGLETPLIDHCGLRDVVALRIGLTPIEIKQLQAEVKDQRVAINLSRELVKTGEMKIGGLTVDRVENVDATVEEIAKHRTIAHDFNGHSALVDAVLKVLKVDSSRTPTKGMQVKIAKYTYELGQIELGSDIHLDMSDVASMMSRELSKKVAQRATIEEICYRVHNMKEIVLNAGAMSFERVIAR